MKNKDQILLIEGKFKPEEAREILTNLLLAKIRFHQLKNFSSQERNGCDDSSSTMRIPQLEESLDQIIKMMAEAEQHQILLKIHSEIHIECIHDENRQFHQPEIADCHETW